MIEMSSVAFGVGFFSKVHHNNGNDNYRANERAKRPRLILHSWRIMQ